MVSLKPESRWVFPCFFERNGFVANSAYAREGRLVFSSLWLPSLHRASYVSRDITWGRLQLVHTWYRTQSCTHFWLKYPLSGIQFPHTHQHNGLAEPCFFLTIPFPSQPGENEPKSPLSKTIHKAWTWVTSTLHISSRKPSSERGQRVGVFSSWSLPSASVVRKHLEGLGNNQASWLPVKLASPAGAYLTTVILC